MELPARCAAGPSAPRPGPRCLTVSAGDSGPVPARRHCGAQGPQHGGRRGEQVRRHRLPILLPAVSEWLFLSGSCVSVVSLPSLLPPCAHPFFFSESLRPRSGADSSSPAHLPRSPWAGEEHPPQEKPPSDPGPGVGRRPLARQTDVVLQHRPHRRAAPSSRLCPDRRVGRLQAWQALKYACRSLPLVP